MFTMADLAKERALPLSENQRVVLLRLIFEHGKVLNNKSTSCKRVQDGQKAAWQDITKRFNASYPDEHPRSEQQLRRTLEHVQRK